ncbi:hypothetical protein LEMLEM_LOCUS2511 [Lemmus lemmus]
MMQSGRRTAEVGDEGAGASAQCGWSMMQSRRRTAEVGDEGGFIEY